jgi:signal transduction histidine kinase
VPPISRLYPDTDHVREGPIGVSHPDSPGWLRLAGRAVVWGVVFWLAGQVSLVTSLPDQPLVLVAPSSGVLLLWFCTTTERSLPYDVVAMALSGMLTSWQLGLPWGLVLFGVVISLVQVAIFVGTMRRWAGDLAPFGPRTQWRLGDLGVFVTAAVVTALASAALSTASQALAGLPSGDLATFLVRWGRASSTIVGVCAVGLLVGPRLVAALRSRSYRGWPAALRRTTSARRVEALALVVFAAAVYSLCFYLLEDLPITFVLFVATAWVGLRFSPPAAATYSLFGGAICVVATLNGHGAFAVEIPDPAQRAVVAQLFVMVTAATGLSLSIARAEQAAAEAVAEARSAMLDQVLHAADDGFMLLEGDGRVLMVNPAGKRLFGIPAGAPMDRVLPASSFSLFEADGQRLVEERAPYLRALRGEHVVDEELELRDDEGRVVRYLRLSAERLPALGPSDPPRALVTYHDITPDRLRQDALATFAGHLAHDLRNPLSVVEAWNEVLSDAFQDGDVTADFGRPMVAKIGAASTRMRDFIQGLLEYTLARDRALKPEPVDLVTLATDVAELRAQATGTHEPPVIRVIGSGTAWADHELVRIVVDNLVANAVKYVAPGVRPHVMVIVEPVDPGTVSLTVTDNGIGIPEDQRELVFESFHRVEQAGRFEGTGLGLGICQRIVERHGGAIVVEDVPSGASLRVTLPRSIRLPEAPEDSALVAEA